MPGIPIRGLTLWHETLGDGGSPVLMLHGNGEDHRGLLPLARRLASRHVVHLIDSRNHGQSSRHADCSYRAMAEDTAAFIESQRAGPMAIVGFSDGAIIALLLALSRPELVTRLALLGPNLSPADFKPEARAWIANRWQETHDPLMRLMLTEPNIPLADLRRIAAPAWVIAGEDDACPRPVFEAIAAHLPQGRLSVLPGHDHFSYIFNSDELAEPMLAFLAGD
jgi:pimeloyl-ACP methyl ester carboxylesterase